VGVLPRTRRRSKYAQLPSTCARPGSWCLRTRRADSPGGLAGRNPWAHDHLATEMPRHLGFASCTGSNPTRLSAWRVARPACRGQWRSGAITEYIIMRGT
jgi:hypothetical protein